MAFVVAVIEVDDSIADLNEKVYKTTKPHESVTGLKNICQALLAGAKDGTVQITVRDTDPSVATHGSGSTQESHDLT